MIFVPFKRATHCMSIPETTDVLNAQIKFNTIQI